MAILHILVPQYGALITIRLGLFLAVRCVAIHDAQTHLRSDVSSQQMLNTRSIFNKHENTRHPQEISPTSPGR